MYLQAYADANCSIAATAKRLNRDADTLILLIKLDIRNMYEILRKPTGNIAWETYFFTSTKSGRERAQKAVADLIAQFERGNYILPPVHIVEDYHTEARPPIEPVRLADMIGPAHPARDPLTTAIDRLSDNIERLCSMLSMIAAPEQFRHNQE